MKLKAAAIATAIGLSILSRSSPRQFSIASSKRYHNRKS